MELHPAQAGLRPGDERDDGRGREAAAVAVHRARPPGDRREHARPPDASHREEVRKAMAGERASARRSGTTIPRCSPRTPSRGTTSGGRRGTSGGGSTRWGVPWTARNPPAGNSARWSRVAEPGRRSPAEGVPWEVEAGWRSRGPRSIPRLVAGTVKTDHDLKEEIEVLRHLRKHLERTLTNTKGVPKTGRKPGRRQAGDGSGS